MNYSGDWTVKDVWETGGWEPRANQLTWQRYELAAAVNNTLQDNGNRTEPDKGGQNESSTCRIKTEGQDTEDASKDGAKITSASSFATLARKLTHQVVERQDPIITSTHLQRDFLLKLSKIPWTEQKLIKESFDSTVIGKKPKKVEKTCEPTSRNPTVPAKLDLKQIGKSVKYAKARGRMQQVCKADTCTKTAPVLGKLSGEWETEHSFLCSVCGIEYDDILEIMHHKWEAHPHCLVAHVSLKENLHRPPALMYPQVCLRFLMLKVVYDFDDVLVPLLNTTYPI